MAGIYIHIPFCVKKCSYCDFFSIPYVKNISDEYVKIVAEEIDLYCTRSPSLPPVRTLYVGGGTPSLIPIPSFQILLESLRRYFPLDHLEEFTLEANPGTLTREKLEFYRESGLTRISMGAQSFDDDILTTLGRIHGKEDTYRAMEMAELSGFHNVNIDLIFGGPGQTVTGTIRDLALAHSLFPSHVSFYALTLEEGTPLYEQVERGIPMPTDEECAETYYKGKWFLEEKGYRHYEISNFSKEGMECLHNMAYWKGTEYIAFGAGAAGYFLSPSGEGTVRYRNVSHLESYRAQVRSGTLPREQSEAIDEESSWRERCITGLRLIEGISPVEMERMFGKIPSLLSRSLEDLLERGFLVEEAGKIRIPEKLLFTSNEILAKLL